MIPLLSIHCPFCQKEVRPKLYFASSSCSCSQHNYFGLTYNDFVVDNDIDNLLSKIRIVKYDIVFRQNNFEYHIASWIDEPKVTNIYYHNLSDNLKQKKIKFDLFLPIPKNLEDIKHQINRLLNLKAFL